MATTYAAAIDEQSHYFAALDEEGIYGSVYGIGQSEAEAVREAQRQSGDPGDGYMVVPCSSAAAAYVEAEGGAPEHILAVTSDGVSLDMSRATEVQLVRYAALLTLDERSTIPDELE